MKMKKISVILLTYFISFPVFSDSGVYTSLELENGKHKNNDGYSLSISPYKTFNNGITVDLEFASSIYEKSSNDDGVYNSIELGLYRGYNITNKLDTGIRFGLGKYINIVTNNEDSDDFMYYTIEPNLNYRFNKNIGLNTSYRYHDAVNKKYEYKLNIAKVGISYNATKNDEFGIKYIEKYGDIRSNGYEFMYNRGFD